MKKIKQMSKTEKYIFSFALFFNMSFFFLFLGGLAWGSLYLCDIVNETLNQPDEIIERVKFIMISIIIIIGLSKVIYLFNASKETAIQMAKSLEIK